MHWLKKIQEDRGVTALEFAIVFPFFVFLLFFLIEYARQQIIMTWVERIAVHATFIARGTEDPSTLTDESIRGLFDQIPAWMYKDNDSDNLKINVVCGDNLEQVIKAPASGFGKKGQTVCLRVSLTSGMITWLATDKSPITRTIETCYVNGRTSPWNTIPESE